MQDEMECKDEVVSKFTGLMALWCESCLWWVVVGDGGGLEDDERNWMMRNE